MTDHHASTTDATDAQPLPYLEVTDDGYAEWAAQHFTVEEPEPGTLVLRGPCPRCNTLIDIPVVSEIFRSTRSISSWIRERRSQSAAVSHVEPMMCTCDDPHPARPEGHQGCGAYWTITISTSPR